MEKCIISGCGTIQQKIKNLFYRTQNMWDTSRFTEALGAELARSSPNSMVVVENIAKDPSFYLTIELDDVSFRVARAEDASCLTAQCTQEEESSAHYSVSATNTTPLIQRIAQACFQAYEELSLARVLEEELSAQSLRFARHFPPAHIVHDTAQDMAFLLAVDMFESVLGQGKDGVQTLTLDPKQARFRAPVQSCLASFQKIKLDVFGPDFEDTHMADKEKITFVYLYQMLPTLRKHLPHHFLTTRWGAAQYDKVGLTLRFQGDGENEHPMQICM